MMTDLVGELDFNFIIEALPLNIKVPVKTLWLQCSK